MKVLAFASYPVEAAATRYRLIQYISPLAERGINLSVRSFLDSDLFADFYNAKAAPKTALGLLKASLLRMRDVVAATKADVILVQREAMIFGPPVIEWLMTKAITRPMVLDLDDATYVPYTSPTYGTIGRALKWFSKTDDLIRWASIVVCGNSAIAGYVKSKGTRATVIPTVVDLEIFRPATARNKDLPVIGWVGTHSTFPYLETIFPVLQELATKYDFVLRIVGAGRKQIGIPGVNVENFEWTLAGEVEHFRSFDIGLYPIVSGLYGAQWEAGKSGFKAIQYLAVGVPYVASPVGAVNEIGAPGVTHLTAKGPDEWLSALSRLLSDEQLRTRMGDAGREHSLQYFSLAAQADKFANVLMEAREGSR